MNISVIPIAEGQGSPAGVVQAGTAGTVAGAPHDEFAVTFGATLRQSPKQGTALLQNGEAKEFVSGKAAGGNMLQAGAGLGTVDFVTEDLRTIKSEEPALSSELGSVTTLNSLKVIDLQMNGVGATGLEDTVQNARAGLETNSAVLKAVYENSNVDSAGAVSQGKTIAKPGTKSAASIANPKDLPHPGKAIIAAKTNSTAQLGSLEKGLTSSVLLPQVAISDINVTNPSGSVLDTSLADGKGVLDLNLSSNLATQRDSEDGLTTGIRVSEKVTIRPHVSEEITALLGTSAKAPASKSAAQPEQETVLNGVPNTVKTSAADVAEVSLNGNMLPIVAPASWTVINSAGTRLAWNRNAPDPVNPDAPVKADMSEGNPTVLGRTGARDSRDSAAVAEGDTNFEAAIQAISLTASKMTTESLGITQTADSSSVLVASPTNDFSAAAKPINSLPTVPPNTRPNVTSASVNSGQQSAVDVSLKNSPEAIDPAAIRSDTRSAKPAERADVTTQSTSKQRAEQPIEARVSADEPDIRTEPTGRPVFQEVSPRVKPLDDSAKPQSVQREISGASSATAMAPVASANGHVSDRSPSIAPVVGNEAASVLPAVSALQIAAQGTTAIPHVAVDAGGPGMAENLTVFSTLEAGRHSSTATAISSEPYRTISATPTALEVGVPDGTQGWLRIRAEVSEQGGVNASLAAGSSATQEMLHRQMPALNAYLHSEQISVSTSVVDRVFAAAGTSLQGFAAGSNGASSDTSGRSQYQEASGQSAMAMTAGNQGSGTSGNSGQRNHLPITGAVSTSISAQSHDSQAGVIEPIVTKTLRDGESGRWLNVRV